MKQKQILSIALVILMISFGCKKSETTPATDLGTNAAGTYSGNFTVMGQNLAGICQITKVSSTSVNVVFTFAGQSGSTMSGVTLTDGGNGKVNLSYSDAGGTLNGTVQNKTLTISITSGGITMTFSGTKP